MTSFVKSIKCSVRLDNLSRAIPVWLWNTNRFVQSTICFSLSFLQLIEFHVCQAKREDCQSLLSHPSDKLV